MATGNPTSLNRPKPIGVDIDSSFGEQVSFQAWLIKANNSASELISSDDANNRIFTGDKRKGTLQMSWFNVLTWEEGDKVIVSFAGKAYGSGSVVLSGTGSQKISQITGVTTALPGVNM